MDSRHPSHEPGRGVYRILDRPGRMGGGRFQPRDILKKSSSFLIKLEGAGPALQRDKHHPKIIMLEKVVSSKRAVLTSCAQSPSFPDFCSWTTFSVVKSMFLGVTPFSQFLDPPLVHIPPWEVPPEDSPLSMTSLPQLYSLLLLNPFLLCCTPSNIPCDAPSLLLRCTVT